MNQHFQLGRFELRGWKLEHPRLSPSDQNIGKQRGTLTRKKTRFLVPQHFESQQDQFQRRRSVHFIQTSSEAETDSRSTFVL